MCVCNQWNSQKLITFSSMYPPSTFWLFSVTCMNTPFQQHPACWVKTRRAKNSWQGHGEIIKESKDDETVFENYRADASHQWRQWISLWEARWVGLGGILCMVPSWVGFVARPTIITVDLELFFLNQWSENDKKINSCLRTQATS